MRLRRISGVPAYLDHAATTPLRVEAQEAWLAAPPGNASSLHATGRKARRVLEEAREEVAADLGVPPGDVIFTSGATMADNLAVQGIHAARATEDPRRDVILVSAVEHHAVLDAAAATGARVERLGVDASGRVVVAELAESLARFDGRVSLVAVMSANNEVGTVQPIAEVAELGTGAGVPLHVDAVQSVGWWGLPAAPGATFAISGHKVGAPVGTGALVLPATTACRPLVYGGGQERKIHSGTLNVAGAAALAAGLTASLASGEASGEAGMTIADLRVELVAVVEQVAGARVVTPADTCLPGIVSAIFEGCEADAVLMLLDAAGVECSTGSACTAGIPEPSHVLAAMGASPEQARSGLRFSLGWTSSLADVRALGEALPGAVARSREASARTRRNRAVTAS